MNAKIYDSNNKLIHESNQYFSEQKVAIFPISEIEDESLFRSIYNKIIRFFGLDSIRHLKYANDYNVVANALDGSKNIVVNKNEKRSIPMIGARKGKTLQRMVPTIININNLYIF